MNNNEELISEQTIADTPMEISNTPLLWMHLTWWAFRFFKT